MRDVPDEEEMTPGVKLVSGRQMAHITTAAGLYE